ncbi:hypothetical protein PAMP_001182 [Pampus punctatissimus]
MVSHCSVQSAISPTAYVEEVALHLQGYTNNRGTLTSACAAHMHRSCFVRQLLKAAALEAAQLTG